MNTQVGLTALFLAMCSPAWAGAPRNPINTLWAHAAFHGEVFEITDYTSIDAKLGPQPDFTMRHSSACAEPSTTECELRLLDIAVDPTTGIFYGTHLDSDGVTYELYSFDPLTDTTSFKGRVFDNNALEFDAYGQLWAWERVPEGGRLFRFDKEYGCYQQQSTCEEVGEVGFRSGGDLGFAPDGTLFGASDVFDGTPSKLVTIDPSTGEGTLVDEIKEGGVGVTAVWALEVDLNGVLYGGTRYGEFYRIDEMGVAVLLADGFEYEDGPFVFGGLAFEFEAMMLAGTVIES